MLVKAIKTRPLIPPKDDLLSVIKESFLLARRSLGEGGGLKEKSVIVVTSKVVSIWEGMCVEINNKTDKKELIKKEADVYIDELLSQYNVMLTIKDNILIPTSGIDESNANGYYILWPKKPFESARKLYEFFKAEYKLKDFGIIISDSHTTPLRSGIMGIGLSYYGFYPLKDYRGKKDIFGREMKMSQTNIVDSLASAAVYEMGEGAEQTPVAVIEDAGDIEFGKPFGMAQGKDFSKPNPLEISIDDDIYSPILKSANWKKGNK